MRWDLIARRIQDQGLGVEGQTLFIYEMPANVEEGILIKPPLKGVSVDHYIPGYHTCDLQIVIRGLTYEATLVRATAIYNLFHGHSRVEYTEIGSSDVVMKTKQVLADTLPISFPRLEGNGIEFSANFNAVFSLFP